MKEAIANELHRPARRNYPRRFVDIRGLDETWQADLVDMSAYSTINKGHKFLLTVIDVFSKFSWGVPIESKNAVDVPKHLHANQGKEFYNKDFKALMTRHNINMYSTFSNLKASICERFNRTSKSKMWKELLSEVPTSGSIFYPI